MKMTNIDIHHAAWCARVYFMRCSAHFVNGGGVVKQDMTSTNFDACRAKVSTLMHAVVLRLRATSSDVKTCYMGTSRRVDQLLMGANPRNINNRH